MVEIEKWVPPAARHASLSATRLSVPWLSETYSAPKCSTDRSRVASRSRIAIQESTAPSMPPAPKKMKPSARRAARSKAFSPDPPSQTGMARAGLGMRAALSTRSNRPPKSTTGSTNNRRSKSICSSSRALARAEVLSEGFVLNVVPADSHSESESACGQQIDVGGLAGHQCRLPLRKDEHPGGQTDALGDAGELAEHDQRVMERIALGVRAGKWRSAIVVHCAQYVVIGEKVVKPQVLDRFPDQTYGIGVFTEFDLRVDDTNLHELSLLHSPCRWAIPLEMIHSTRAMLPASMRSP